MSPLTRKRERDGRGNISAGHFSWSSAEHIPQRLIAPPVVEPTVLVFLLYKVNKSNAAPKEEKL